MTSHRSRLLAPTVVLLLTIGAIASVWLLVDRINASRQAQLQVASMRLSLGDLQNAPFRADPSAGSTATATRAAIESDEKSLARGLAPGAQAGVPRRLLSAGSASLQAIEPVVESIYRIGKDGHPGRDPRQDRPARRA